MGLFLLGPFNQNTHLFLVNSYLYILASNDYLYSLHKAKIDEFSEEVEA